MCLGVPVIASNVGGVADLIDDRINGILYPFNEFYMLRYYIGQIFDNEAIAQGISENAVKKAEKLYNREENLQTIMQIYDIIRREK